MKRLTIYSLLFVVLCGFLGNGCRLSDKRKFTINAPDVKNEACAQRVERALRSLDGVDLKLLEFDFSSGTITVTYESMKLGQKNIEHAIARAGFNANTIPADERARAALPQECR
ncbi:MAG: heavy-metal-associated domain-containing protein [Lentisphaerae bacterium]|jgi:copper chaperone CopZ|nr:heavy-metal-associated domain-containing protein [Lentisphaerota bacterium]